MHVCVRAHAHALVHSHAPDEMVFVDRVASRAAEELKGVVAELREKEEEGSRAREAESRRRREAEDELRKVLDNAGEKEIYYREIESRAKLSVEEAAKREKMARVEADALKAALEDKDGAVWWGRAYGCLSACSCVCVRARVLVLMLLVSLISCLHFALWCVRVPCSWMHRKARLCVICDGFAVSASGMGACMKALRVLCV